MLWVVADLVEIYPNSRPVSLFAASFQGFCLRYQVLMPSFGQQSSRCVP